MQVFYQKKTCLLRVFDELSPHGSASVRCKTCPTYRVTGAEQVRPQRRCSFGPRSPPVTLPKTNILRNGNDLHLPRANLRTSVELSFPSLFSLLSPFFSYSDEKCSNSRIGESSSLSLPLSCATRGNKRSLCDRVRSEKSSSPSSSSRMTFSCFSKGWQRCRDRWRSDESENARWPIVLDNGVR